MAGFCDLGAKKVLTAKKAISPKIKLRKFRVTSYEFRVSRKDKDKDKDIESFEELVSVKAKEKIDLRFEIKLDPETSSG